MIRFDDRITAIFSCILHICGSVMPNLFGITLDLSVSLPVI